MRRKTGKSDGKTDKPRGDRRSGQNKANRDANSGTGVAARSPKRSPATYYPPALKIQACVAALTVNPEHPTSQAAMDAAKAILNADIAPSTISLWIRQNETELTALMPAPNTAQLVNETQQAVVAKWLQLEDKALDALLDEKMNKLGTSSARDLAVVAGISRTHLSKMVGIDPTFLPLAVRFQNVCERLGLPVEVLEDYIMVLERRALPPISVNAADPAIEPGSDTTG